MGVHGLWKLIDKAGRPIPLETLENKILAIDVSIWLYQLVRGFDSSARPGSNLFLLGFFHRICKLLFYRIKPIFVFDGGAPSLKKKTLEARQRGRRRAQESLEKVRSQLLENLIKQQALGDVLGERVKIPKQFSSKQDELFWLPPTTEESVEKVEESDGNSDSDDDLTLNKYAGDLNSVDVTSNDFLRLPADVRHDILTDLKETRKLNSWARVHLMPEEADEFSNFQLGRLLKRRAVQVGLDQAAEELGARGFTVNDLQNILTEQGVDLSQRIASDNSTRFIYAGNIDSDENEGKPSELSAGEEECSELVRPSRSNLSESSSSEGDPDDLPVIERIAQSDNGGLSQQEILELIKQQANRSAKPDYCNSWGEASTSRLSEPCKSSGGMSARPSSNDQLETREKISVEDNEKSKLEPEKFPEADFFCTEATVPQKGGSLCSNQLEEVSPCKKTEGAESNEVLMGERNVHAGDRKPSNSVESDLMRSGYEYVCRNAFEDLMKDEGSFGELVDDMIPIELQLDAKQISNFPVMGKSEPTSSLEIVIDPNAEVEYDDLFADVFSAPVAADIAKLESSDSDDGSSGNTSLLKPPKSDLAVTCESPKNHKVELSMVSIPKEKSTASPVAVEESSKNVPFIKEKLEATKALKPSFQKFVSEIKKLSSTNDLSDVQGDLERESAQLASQNKREEKLSSTITEQISQDAQELLHLFGIPYLVAPMEAEAQCAYLDLTGQTDGTITDDSDVWLFGARNVYKNFFDQKKFVKQFKSSDIFQCYHLNRDDLIMIALLVGSDYTTGLNGVGPVNAIEIVAHFPTSETATTPQARLMKFVDAYMSEKLNPKLLKKLKSVEFSEGFPSDEVVKAYQSPMVDQSEDRFSWSPPDLDNLRLFMRERFGWDPRKTDKTLGPIVEQLSKNTTQRTIYNYFDWAFEAEEVSTVSKRVGNAVEMLTTGVVPSPTKKVKKSDAKDRTVSNYSRRKYGKYQDERDAEPAGPAEPEGTRAARAAARATLAPTRKPRPGPSPSEGASGSSAPAKRPKLTSSSPSPATSSRSADWLDNQTVNLAGEPSPRPSTSTAPPQPALSDILCGVGPGPIPSWTPSKDLISPYVKRKYGKAGKTTSSKKEPAPPSQRVLPTVVIPSKTPAQIARERAAKKLKEAKKRAQENNKSKKNPK